ARDIGWQPLMLVHFGTYLVILGTVFLRQRISFQNRAFVFLAILFLAGTASVLTWGLIGMGVIVLITWSVLTAILYGLRAGLAAVFVSMVVTSVTGVGIALGLFSLRFNVNVYAVAPSSWIMVTVGVGLLGSIMVASLGRSHESLIESIDTLNKSMDELHQANERLVNEIKTREGVEKSLVESKQRYRSLFDYHPDGVCSFDLTGKFISVNAGMEKLTGYHSEELGQMSFFDILTVMETKRVKVHFQKVANGNPQEFQATGIRKDQSRFDANVTIIPIVVDLEIVGVYGLCKDITDSRRAEEALKVSEAKLTRVSYMAHVGHWDWTLRTGEIIWSEEVYRIFGYEPDSINPTYAVFIQTIHPDDLERVKAAVDPRPRNYAPCDIEFRFFRQDGTIGYGHALWEIVKDEAGQSIRVTGSMQDISNLRRAEDARKKLEFQLVQAQKMEAIGTLAGGIAHDFNNILSTIIGYTEMAQDDLLTSSQAQDLDQVLKAAYRARDLVKQILIFSRMRNQQDALVPVEIAPVIKEAIKFLRASLPSTVEIHQKIVVEDELVLADPTQIHQILVNLCTNAAHAMREKGGILQIGLRTVDFYSETIAGYPELKPGSYIQLTVADTGHGMDTATMERIFDPYFTTKPVGEGSGFGLAVVHGIVKRSNGTIAVYSEPGQGATFNIYLPRANEELETTDGLPEPVSGGTERILFVDDEEPLNDMSKRMLEQLGYQVVTKLSSVEALSVFQAQPDQFDLVMTDYTMPQMTGVDLAREILRIRPDMPVILCTGFSEMISEEKAKALGILEFVMKPLNRSDTAQVIRRALDRT
ncbi:MAG: PAS domain S-box protein, partial [Deltaproteobacteria bacterium]|nr:PAS domain S-box protein [Deltaproteobacteria bacterium]